jgi:hypothetical protein
VLNVYTPIYDTTMIVIPELLLAGYFYNANKETFPTTFKVFVGLLFILPLIYSFVADTVGFQVYTLLIVAFGLYQLQLFAKVVGVPARAIAAMD